MAKLRATLPTQRLQELDVWRGFALLGVCVVNFAAANADLLTSERADALSTAGFDWRMNGLLSIFLANKAHTIFSFMFGVGVAIIVERASRSNTSSTGLLVRRMLVLLGFGWLHYLLIYSGDILHVYALLGLVLIVVRPLSDRAVAVVGLLLALSGRLFYEERGFFLSLLGMESHGGLAGEPLPLFRDPDALYAVKDLLSAWQFIQLNVAHVLANEADFRRWIPVDCYYLGRAMLGFAFWRSGWGRALFSLDSKHQWRIFAGFAIGAIVLTAYSVLASPGPAGELHHFVYNALRHANFLVVAAAYLAGLAALTHVAFFTPIGRGLAALGRLSLTNYIIQSFGMAFIFFGPGLRLAGSVGSLVAVAIALAFYGSQIAFSQAWLRRWNQGPLEWCWRKLIYL